MTYVPAKPDPGKSPFLDAPTIQGNFASFATAFATNHIALNLFNQGDHANVIFQNQATFPGTTVNADFLFSHNATSKADTQPQLFVKIPKFLPTNNDRTEATNAEMQLTFNTVNLVGPNQFQSFLIGGYLIYFGIVTGAASANPTTHTIILSPAPTKILIAIATSTTMTTTPSPSRPFDVKTVINTTLNDRFTINSLANGSTPIAYGFRWVAIAQA